jgi:hypothetical protein
MNFLLTGLFVFAVSTIAFAADWHDRSARESERVEVDYDPQRSEK